MKLNRILVTHGHHDHFGGLYDVLQLLKSRNQEAKAYKMMTGNRYELSVFQQYPELKNIVEPLSDNQEFQIDDDLHLRAIYTPGHLDDHMSFYLTTPSERVLITGDIILGSPSAVVEDLDTYLKTLRKLQKMKIDYLLLPHSLDKTDPSGIMVSAEPKIGDYIKYREDRL